MCKLNIKFIVTKGSDKVFEKVKRNMIYNLKIKKYIILL